MDIVESDILVIGGGIAGLVSVFECLNRGFTVTLVDRDSEENVGGLAKLAFGGMALMNTPLQRRMGINDSPELGLRDWLSFAQFKAEDVWPKRWAEYYVTHSCDRVFNWLTDLGLRFFPAVNWVERGLQGDGNSVPRYHVIWGTGYRLVEMFLEHIESHPNRGKLSCYYDCQVLDLTKDSDRITGCLGRKTLTGADIQFKASNTIVATGGINGNIEKVKQHWCKDWGSPPEEILNGSHPYADGAMHDAIASYGGRVTHLDKMWNYAAGIPHPQPKFDGQGLSLIPCKSALWLDATGKRIGPEPLVTGFDTNDLCRRVSQLEHSHTWQVLNWRIAAKEFAISGSEHNPSIRDRKLFKFLKEVLLGNHELVNKIAAESDHFIVADSLEELVDKMQALDGEQVLERDSVLDAVGSYDEMLSRGKSLWNDDQVRRILQARSWRSDKVRTCKPEAITSKGSAPLIAIKLRLISRKSLGGIQTNLASQVIGFDDEVIPGLFAVGEAAGFGGGGASGFKSLEGTFLSGCILTARSAVDALKD